MKKGDPLAAHRELMKNLHLQFTKKTQYHTQKAYLELKDVHWLVHEFFAAFLGKDFHFTEEEIMRELKDFKHEYIILQGDVLESWQQFFLKLTQAQYAGSELSQEQLRSLVTQFSSLVDQTVGREYAPPDAFTRHIQAAKIFLTNGDADKAEESYKQLMREYDTLDNDKKRVHYEQLSRLYQSILALRSGQPVVPQ